MDHAPATRRIGPVEPAKRQAIEASKAATRAARAERHVSEAIVDLQRASGRHGAGVAADGLLTDTGSVMFPEGSYDDFASLKHRLATIKFLEQQQVRGASLVAAMATYNAAQAGDAGAVHEWAQLIICLAAAQRDACPPPPKGYWDRTPHEPCDNDPWI